MGRIPPADYQLLNEYVKKAHKRTADYHKIKQSSVIPDPNSNTLKSANQACEHLRTLFFEHKFNLIDVIVAECGKGPTNENDTHFRGRILESVLNGSFNGLAEPDFKYGDLKLIETQAPHVLEQVLTVGRIFRAIDKAAGQYEIESDYYCSGFYSKMKQAVIVTYRKQAKQAGVTPDSVFVFRADDAKWAKELKEDWESIGDEMTVAIKEYRAGKRKRRKSGICSSDTDGRRRPHGYLGIRSDGVIFTRQFFELISRHYNK